MASDGWSFDTSVGHGEVMMVRCFNMIGVDAVQVEDISEKSTRFSVLRIRIDDEVVFGSSVSSTRVGGQSNWISLGRVVTRNEKVVVELMNDRDRGYFRGMIWGRFANHRGILGESVGISTDLFSGMAHTAFGADDGH